MKLVFRVQGGIGQNYSGDAPELQFGSKAFPLARGFMNDPMPFFPEVFRGGASEGDEKRMRCLIGMVEYNMAFTLGECCQMLGELGSG